MLMRTVSGIRGIVGTDLTPQALVDHVNGLLQLTKAKRVVVGRDSRISGPAIESLVCTACELYGCEVYRLGLATTPTVELAVRTLNCDAGIIITASHNDAPWNALKLLDGNGAFLVEDQVNELIDLVDNRKFSWAPYDKLGKTIPHNTADDEHIKYLFDLPYIDVEKIRAKKFKVACDCVNGAGSVLLPRLLKELGCELTSIYDTPDGLFPRGAEPVPESLKDLEKAVLENDCVVGLAMDPDADRCALVSNKGRAVGEEYTLAMATDVILGKKEGNVAVNLSTSRINEDIAAKHGRTVFRSKVGEINVTQKIKAENCAIGGEGNGGVILPDTGAGRDGLLAAALVLQWLADSDQTVEDFVETWPKYKMGKGKIGLGGVEAEAIFAELEKRYPDATISTLDGMKLDLPDFWIHVRKSNTEPIIRLMTESAVPGKADALIDELTAMIDKLR